MTEWKNGPRRRRWRPSRRLTVAGLGLVVALAVGLTAAGRMLVVRVDAGGEPDVILSLGSHEWERLPEAARQAGCHPRARVALSVPVSVNKWNCHRCNERVPWLLALGVPAERIALMPQHVHRTYDEATALRAYMGQNRLGHVLVVTSPYHTRRTWLTFSQVLGATTRVSVVPASAFSPSRPGAWWWYGYDRAYVAYEWAAIVLYRVKFGVPLLRVPSTGHSLGAGAC